MSQATGVLLCGHGSRNPHTATEFAALLDALSKRLPGRRIASGFLEHAEPTIEHGLDELRRADCRRIAAVPAMLFAASHVKADLPALLEAYGKTHEEVEIAFGAALGPDPRMIAAAAARVRETGVPPEKSTLVLIGRGASDPEAQGGLWQVMRGLWSECGFAWGEVGFAGAAVPDVASALGHAARLGYPNVVAMPYLLLTGRVLHQVAAAVEEARGRHDNIAFTLGGHLADHRKVVETLTARTIETEARFGA